MWVKWAENQNKTQTTIVDSEEEFYELLTSPTTEVTHLGLGLLEIFRGERSRREKC